MKRRPETRPFHLVLILLCAGLLVQCGSSDDADTACVPSLLTAGNYAFTLGTVSDECAGGWLALFIQEEYPVPPPQMSLPAFGELPATIDMNLPFVGMVQANLSVLGNSIRMNLTPSNFSGTIPSVPPLPEIIYDLSASGNLCPISTARVDVSLVLDVHSLEAGSLQRDNCSVVISLTGDLL